MVTGEEVSPKPPKGARSNVTPVWKLGHDATAISRDYPHSLADEDVLTITRTEQRILSLPIATSVS